MTYVSSSPNPKRLKWNPEAEEELDDASELLTEEPEALEDEAVVPVVLQAQSNMASMSADTSAIAHVMMLVFFFIIQSILPIRMRL